MWPESEDGEKGLPGPLECLTPTALVWVTILQEYAAAAGGSAGNWGQVEQEARTGVRTYVVAFTLRVTGIASNSQSEVGLK